MSETGTNRSGRTITADQVSALMDRVYHEPYRDSSGRYATEIVGQRTADAIQEIQMVTADDVFEGARLLGETRAQAKERLFRRQYVGRQREYMQVDGKPYSTHDWRHFYSRYGTPHRPGIILGVYAETPETMMRVCAAERSATIALRLLGQALPG